MLHAARGNVAVILACGTKIHDGEPPYDVYNKVYDLG
jgi:hypothetical protein